MVDEQGAGRLLGLLRELEELLAGAGPPGERGGLDVQLAAWRSRMDQARSEIEPDLTPGEREALVHMSRRLQGRLAETIQNRERDKRVLLVRILSSHAVQGALEGYRTPVRQGFFERTV